ncbi:MAG: DUF2786 domain-containing protein [Oscillospiraceae bacterium]|nr:DUF2786 domain-containing protein [Oscillospiraceae bacterium]
MKTLDKIKKLLNLSSNNSNPEESQSALLKAQELMIKNNINQQEIVDYSTEKSIKDISKDIVYNQKRHPWYIKIIGHIVSKNFKILYYYQRNNSSKNIIFYGYHQDVNIAHIVFNDILEKIKYYLLPLKKRYKRYINKGNYNTDKNSFIKGYLDGIKQKFETQVSDNNWGLIIQVDKIVQKEYDSFITVGKSYVSKSKYSLTNKLYQDGFEKGVKYTSNQIAIQQKQD